MQVDWKAYTPSTTEVGPFCGQSTCYWKKRDTMVVFGGVGRGNNNNNNHDELVYREGLYLLDLEKVEWSHIVRKEWVAGKSCPALRSRHCCAIDDERDRMYIFGGHHKLTGHYHDFWILFLKPMLWKEVKLELKTSFRSSWNTMVYLQKEQRLIIRGEKNFLVVDPDSGVFDSVEDRRHTLCGSDVLLKRKGEKDNMCVTAGGYSRNAVFVGNISCDKNMKFQIDIRESSMLEKGRMWHAACAGPAEQTCLVFGGLHNYAINDLIMINHLAKWVWIRERRDSDVENVPGRRIYASMVWSEKQKKVFVVGGEDSEFEALEDTKVYAGTLIINPLQQWKKSVLVTVLMMANRNNSCWSVLSKDILRYFCTKYIIHEFHWKDSYFPN